ncbi:MAG: MmcQ/YjbR family DNA-binding protein [Clostridiales bacterium]|nr:MmcQ/YjbR family DNA-binding protein [Clostridiales bacterium]
MNSELLDYIHDTEILDYCLQKNGAYVDYPFGADYITVKVKNSRKNVIFAEIFVLDRELKLTFSTDECTAQKLRSDYADIIVKGWHCPPVQAKYKSTVAVDGVSMETLQNLIDMSYDRAIFKLK